MTSEKKHKKTIPQQSNMPGDTYHISAGRDVYKGDVHGNVMSGQFIQGNQAQQLSQSFSPQSSREEVLTLLAAIQQELERLDLPSTVKEEAELEIKGAELQVKKNPPAKKKMVEKLKNAVAALKEMGNLSKEAVALGNLIGKAIEWGGETWTEGMI